MQQRPHGEQETQYGGAVQVLRGDTATQARAVRVVRPYRTVRSSIVMAVLARAGSFQRLLIARAAVMRSRPAERFPPTQPLQEGSTLINAQHCMHRLASNISLTHLSLTQSLAHSPATLLLTSHCVLSTLSYSLNPTNPYQLASLPRRKQLTGTAGV